MRTVVYTVGHSNRSLEEFLDILRKFNIERVIDVRRWPTSKYKHFCREVLEDALREAGIDYVWIPQLGGYRKFGIDVPESLRSYACCFSSEGFRAYAAYITARLDVKRYLVLLEELAREKTSVIMCSERMYFRCHRKILADYLYVRGFNVIHIVSIERVIEHRLSRCARIVNGELAYK